MLIVFGAFSQGNSILAFATPTPLKRKAKKTVPDPLVQPATPMPEPPSAWRAYFVPAITGLFFVLSFVGILRHEMWRDEYQAWMVAADADSLSQLFKNLKYEGHPPLWHLVLFAISAFTDDPFWMQLLHIGLSTAFVYLINRHAPFTILQKVLLTFSYYLFFEYNLISRSYGLTFLLLVIFCILYQNRQKYLLWMAVVLFLASNISIFGVMLAGGLGGIIILEFLFRDRKKKKAISYSVRDITLFAGILLSGMVFGYLQIRPEPDNSFFTQYVTGWDPVRAKWAFSRFIHAYFAIPNFREFHFWNTNFFVPDETRFQIIITSVIFLIWLIAFIRSRLIWILYAGGTLLLLVFYYYTGFIWARYAGHLFMLLIVCLWLAYYQKEKSFRALWLDRLSLIGAKIRQPFFILVLAASFLGGVIAYVMDIKHPFSTSEEAANFIKENKLDSFEILGSKDYIISPLATQLGKKIFYAERKEPGSFIIYDQVRTNIWSFSEVEKTISDKWSRDHKRIILVKDLPIYMTFHDTGESVLWEDAALTDSLSLTLLKHVPPGIVGDETYYIYTIDAIYPR